MVLVMGANESPCTVLRGFKDLGRQGDVLVCVKTCVVSNLHEKGDSISQVLVSRHNQLY